MSGSGDLINFDVIETQKENIQSLPGGRSAKALAQIFSSGSNGDKYHTPSPNDTRTLNDGIRQEYEAELQASADSDDPLDVYDRYVKWTLDAYPSAQATAESGLLPLLERGTKAFLTSAHYRNDPRYLRLWLQYIRLFSDSPRETFSFLARHHVGEGLALFYEEFAGWLESAGRWTQAEEVYKLGLERDARPQERLLRRFGEFQIRFEQRPQGGDGPSSPALPTVRPALAAKVDPFATARTTDVDPQAQQPRGIGGRTTTKSGKQKLAIFSDSENPRSSQPPVSGLSKGWDNIGSLRDRRKENEVEAKPWVGETLKSEKKQVPVQKMAVFRDESKSNAQTQSNAQTVRTHTPEHHVREAINPRTGRRERVFVNLEAVYPDYKNPNHEVCFEELRAASRGWLKKDWGKIKSPLKEIPINSAGRALSSEGSEIVDNYLAKDVKQNLVLEEGSPNDERRERRLSKVKKIKVKEIGETHTIKTNLDSPTGPRIKRKNTSEPTMTMHTRAATDEIYSIFNQPLKTETEYTENGDGFLDSEYEDDDNTSVGESTGTGRISAGHSEFGDEETRAVDDKDEDDEHEGEWTEFTASRLIPGVSGPGYNQDEDGRDTFSEPEDINSNNKYIPKVPEDYNPPLGPYRDAAVMAQNRLPFMTPIIEKTESSLPSFTAGRNRYYDTKTPCKTVPEVDFTPTNLPVEDLLLEDPEEDAVTVNVEDAQQSPSLAVRTLRRTPVKHVSPFKITDTNCIIKDAQCDPSDWSVRKKILRMIEPPLTSFAGYNDQSSSFGALAADILKYSKSTKKTTKSGERLSSTPPLLNFKGGKRTYAIKRQLGAGAYAPVYLAESVGDTDSSVLKSKKGGSMEPYRLGLEAIKVETDPPNAWEFYMITMAHNRIRASPSYWRASESIVRAHELHLFKDESYLIEDYQGQGTLLDLVNIIRTEAMTTTGNPEAGMDEALAMFFSVELFRTVEALHACGILHGDIKPDNCLVRFEEKKSRSSLSSNPSESLLDAAHDDTTVDPSETHYSVRGSCGWRDKGLTLIDFGRAVDMKAFRSDVQFIAEWEMSQHDCNEVREMRPWTYQIDLYGVAVTIHTMLFGKYLESVPIDNNNNPRNSSGGGDYYSSIGTDTTDTTIKRYRIRESFKRYWDRDLWTDVFDLLLNPGTDRWSQMERGLAGPTKATLPVLQSLKHMRERMEAWLITNAEKKNLSPQIRKLEAYLSRRKEKLEKDR